MSHLPSHAAPSLPTPERRPRVRLALASLSALAAATGMAAILSEERFEPELASLLIPLLGSIAASALFWRRTTGAQLLARAFCWSSLIFGFILTTAIGGKDWFIPATMVWGSGGALLLMGRYGLDAKTRATSAFTPAAFSGALSAGLIMAVADMMTLFMWGGLAVQDSTARFTGSFMLLGGLLMGVAVFGLYRLRMWGVALNIVANLGIAAFALLDPELPKAISYTLAGTALFQLILPLPMIVAMLRKSPPKAAASKGWLLAPLIVTGLMVGCVFFAM